MAALSVLTALTEVCLGNTDGAVVAGLAPRLPALRHLHLNFGMGFENIRTVRNGPVVWSSGGGLTQPRCVVHADASRSTLVGGRPVRKTAPPWDVAST